MRFAGVDIASSTHVLALIEKGGEVFVKPTGVREDAAGYERLFEQRGASAALLVAMEGTGHYWKNLFAAPVARGFAMALSN
jgi:transposase